MIMIMIMIVLMVLLSEKVQRSLIALSLDHQYPILDQLCLPRCHHDKDDHDKDDDDGDDNNGDHNGEDEEIDGDHQYPILDSSSFSDVMLTIVHNGR